MRDGRLQAAWQRSSALPASSTTSYALSVDFYSSSCTFACVCTAKPPPKTLSPEYKEKEREYLRAQNANPILGLSSVKKDPRAERDDDS